MRRRERLAKLRRLALGGDEASLRQAAEVLGALGDAELWRQVLEGCGLRTGEPVLGEGFFRGPERTLGERRLAWLTLVGAAPPDAPMDASLLAPEALRLIGWRLPRWPSGPFPRFASVRELVFDRCWLSALPPIALELPAVEVLVVERARFVDSVPENLWRPPLREVRLDHAWLEAFPAGVAGASTLEELSLRDNRITTLPSDLARRLPERLRILDLRANPLDASAREAAEAAGATMG